MMTQSFLSGNDNENAPVPNTAQTTSPHRESIKHLLIGSPKAVTSTIHVLHQLNYAHVGDWSDLLPTANQGEVMSILSRTISVQQ
jgi:hypothetical protein